MLLRFKNVLPLLAVTLLAIAKMDDAAPIPNPEAFWPWYPFFMYRLVEEAIRVYSVPTVTVTTTTVTVTTTSTPIKVKDPLTIETFRKELRRILASHPENWSIVSTTAASQINAPKVNTLEVNTSATAMLDK